MAAAAIPPDRDQDQEPPPPPAGEGRRRAVVLVPGWEDLKRNQRRDSLATGIALLDARPYRRAGEVAAEGFVASRLVAAPPAAGLAGAAAPVPADHGVRCPAVIDVIEAYWGDLGRPEDEGNAFAQFLRACGLLSFWTLHPGVAKMFRISGAISFGAVFGALVLILWYLDALVVLIQAASSLELPLEGALLQPVRWLIDQVNAALEWLGWGAVLVLVPLFVKWRAMAVARAVAAGARDYLLNRRDQDGLGLRDRLRHRVAEALGAALAAGYDEVVLLGHSFGTLPAVDLLVELAEAPALERVTLVTWGSPAAVMACRAPWLAERLQETRRLAGRLRWIDAWSDADWLCTRVPRPPAEEQGGWGEGSELPLRFDTTLGDRLSGRSHLFYYGDRHALAPLVAPIERPPS